MIESLTVVVPKELVDRSRFDPIQLASFERNTGITKTRRWGNEHAIEILRESVRMAMKDIPTDQIGTVIVVSQTPYRLSPCMAMDVLDVIGLKNIPCFDVNNSCDGWIYGLHLGSFLNTDDKVLVVCMDMLRFGDGIESLIFSDAISVTVIEPGFLESAYCIFKSDPSGIDSLYSSIDGKMKMDGPKVFDWVIKNIPEEIKQMEEKDEEIKSDFIVLHQANLAMLKSIEKRADIVDRSLHSIEEYGNQSMNSIPTALVINEEKILGKRGILCGFGAGWCSATMDITWPEKRIGKIVEL